MTNDAPRTLQQTAASILAHPAAVSLSRADRRFLFGIESWPADLPIKIADQTRLQKLYNRVVKAMGAV